MHEEQRGHRVPVGTEFDDYAGDYAAALQEGLKYSGEDPEYFAAARVRWLARRLRELDFEPRSILDYGCGTGASTPHFLSTLGVREVTGVDVSRGLLERAARQHGSRAATFRLRRDCEPRGEIDIAFCNGVFHHIPPPERSDALQYISRSLRPGGFFAFWENNPWNPGTRFVMSRIPFDRNAVTISPPSGRRLLRHAGFDIVRVDHLFFFPRMLRWLRSLEPRLVTVPVGAQYLVLARKPATDRP
jgi:SAM-dependent methyltransferase